MTALCILLVFLGAIRWAAPDRSLRVTQEGGLRVAAPGDDVILNCSCQTDAVTFFCWYKQTLGGSPQVVALRMKHAQKDNDENAERFKVIKGGAEDTNNHLWIKGVEESDSAMYFCGILIFNAIEFGQGIFLHVKASSPSAPPTRGPPTTKLVRQGEAMDLSCTVQSGPCADQRGLYWVRRGTSAPAVIHASEGRCTDSGGSAAGTCDLTLAVPSAGSENAGTYHCAVASCGEIVFGDAIQVTVSASRVLEYALMAALALTGAASLALAILVRKLKQRVCPVCKGSPPPPARTPAPDAQLTPPSARPARSEDAGSLHYAALSVNRSRERHRYDDDVESLCVYAPVNTNTQ